jgi:glucans biosynthesis protein
VPDRRPAPGKALAFAYRLGWYRDDPRRPPGGRAVWTRRDRGTHEDSVRFVVDFEGKGLRAIPEDAAVRGVVTVGRNEDPAELIEQQVLKNPLTGGWRLVFQVRPKGDAPVELRAFLQRGKDALTETWSYVLEP